MGRRRRPTSTDREFDEMMHEMQDLLLDAVAETVESGGPEPARNRVAQIIDLDEELAVWDAGPPPGQTIALLALAQWLMWPEHEDPVRPDPDDVLNWIGQHVGPRYRARARYMIGFLDSDGANEAIQVYADALGDDFLPALIWIAAALAALYGEGDPAWLTRDRAMRR